MNGIEKITEKIIGDARLESDDIAAKAGEEALAILDEMEKAAAERVNAIVEGARTSAEAVKLRAKGASDLEIRKAVLSTKQEMIDKAFSLALEKLLALKEEQYIVVISQIALSGVLTGTEEVVMSAAEGKKYGKKLVDEINQKLKADNRTAALSLSKESRDISGGLVLKNGDIETNCTFGAVLGQIRPEMTGSVAAGLFSE